MQHEIIHSENIFDSKGNIREVGFSNKPQIYNKSDIKHRLFKIKERDVYYISNRKFGLYIAVLNSASVKYTDIILADFEKGIIKKHIITKLLHFENISMPIYPEKGETNFNAKKCGLKITSAPSRIYIKCDFLDFFNDENLYINLILDSQECDAVYTVRDGKNKRGGFSYNCFRPAMLAKGVVRCGRSEFTADGEKSFAFLNQSRSNISDENSGKTLFANHYLSDNTQFAMRLSCSEGNNSIASDNVIIKNGKTDKLDEINLKIGNSGGKNSYFFTNPDNTLKINFKPLDGIRGSMKATSFDRVVVFGKIEGAAEFKDLNSIDFERLPAIMELPL